MNATLGNCYTVYSSLVYRYLFQLPSSLLTCLYTIKGQCSTFLVRLIQAVAVLLSGMQLECNYSEFQLQLQW